jgi:hypothetical protein
VRVFITATGRASIDFDVPDPSPRRYVMPSGFLMRPLLNGGTLGGDGSIDLATD